MKKLKVQRPQLVAPSSSSDDAIPKVPLQGVLLQDMAWLQNRYVRCSDLVYRQFTVGGRQERQAAVLYFDGMTSSKVVHDNILQPLLIDAELVQYDAENDQNLKNFFSYVKQHLLPAGEITIVEDLEQGCQAMMNGDVLLLLDGCRQAFIVDAKGFPHRSVESSQNEMVLRGPQEAFTEALRVNTALLRRRLRTNQLKFEEKTLGRLTQTQVSIVYLEGVANDSIIAEVHRRLDNLKDVDSILDASCIEQYIEDAPFSIFPQLQYTQRPDKVAASLLEGRIGLIVDGSPEVSLAAADVCAAFAIAGGLLQSDCFRHLYALDSLHGLIHCHYLSFLICGHYLLSSGNAALKFIAQHCGGQRRRALSCLCGSADYGAGL